MKSAVTVSLVPEARGGPFVFWDDLPAACRTAADLGFDAIELFPPSPDAVDPSHLRKLLDDHNLALAAVGTGAGWVKHRLHLALPDEHLRYRAHGFVRSIIDLAGLLGAPAIIGSMQGRSGDGVDRDLARVWLTEAVEDLAAHAATYGVPLIYEPLNRYETDQFNRAADAAAWLRTLSTRNVRLLCDLFHMNIEEADLPAALRSAGELVGHVHFVDSNRRPVGHGHLDIPPVIAALRDIGYTGYLSAEALPYPDPAAAARQTIETFRHFT